jgi:hypothetical protein
MAVEVPRMPINTKADNSTIISFTRRDSEMRETLSNKMKAMTMRILKFIGLLVTWSHHQDIKRRLFTQGFLRGGCTPKM